MDNELLVETPQTGLRFVERAIGDRKVKILQQLWVGVVYPSSSDAVANRNILRVDQEWRDVPLVTE